MDQSRFLDVLVDCNDKSRPKQQMVKIKKEILIKVHMLYEG